jgi:hypothetical protein
MCALLETKKKSKTIKFNPQFYVTIAHHSHIITAQVEPTTPHLAQLSFGVMHPFMTPHLVISRERFVAVREITKVPLFAAMGSSDVSWDI